MYHRAPLASSARRFAPPLPIWSHLHSGVAFAPGPLCLHNHVDFHWDDAGVAWAGMFPRHCFIKALTSPSLGDEPSGCKPMLMHHCYMLPPASKPPVSTSFTPPGFVLPLFTLTVCSPPEARLRRRTHSLTTRQPHTHTHQQQHSHTSASTAPASPAAPHHLCNRLDSPTNGGSGEGTPYTHTRNDDRGAAWSEPPHRSLHPRPHKL